jgi:TolB-like protein
MQKPELTRSSCQELNRSNILLQLDRIVCSHTLARANFLSAFLKCCVEQTLDGNSSLLKELWLGTVVFQRKPGKFNPARDPIVRVQARRLRQKLAIYYRTEGQLDPLRISLPLGSYIPVFSTIDLNNLNVYQSRPRCAVAVLPLTPLGADEDSVRFADAMTAELTTALVASGGMEVVSRTSASAFRGAAQDIRSIGKHLDADFIVEGCVRLADNRHRINLQLTDTETGYHCWAAWFEQRNNGSTPDAPHLAQILRVELSASGFHAIAHRKPLAMRVEASGRPN